MRVGRVIAAASLAAIFALLSLVYIVKMDIMDAFYIAFTFGSTVAAIVSLSEREQSLGTAASFVALVMFLGLVAPYLGLKSVIIFRTATAQVVIPVELIPWLSLIAVMFFAVGAFLGADVGRLGLFVLGVLLSLFWFSVTGPVRVLVSTLVAIIAAIPLIKAEEKRAPRFLAAAPMIVPAMDLSNRAAYIVDLSSVNAAAVLITPILLFIALDPFDIVRGKNERTIEGLASVAVLFLVFLQMLSAVFGI